MVVRKAIEHLRTKSPRERESAAAGIAFAVVAILFLAWGALFIRNLRASGFGPAAAPTVLEIGKSGGF